MHLKVAMLVMLAILNVFKKHLQIEIFHELDKLFQKKNVLIFFLSKMSLNLMKRIKKKPMKAMGCWFEFCQFLVTKPTIMEI